MTEKGKFIVFDGLDLIGKGEAERASLSFLESLGLKVFDQVEFEKSTGKRPRFGHHPNEENGIISLGSFDVAYMGEPSYVGAGSDVRFEQIAIRNKGLYDARETLSGYDFNRLVHFKRCVVPVRTAGKHIIKSRSFASSWCYQGLQAEQEGRPITEEEFFSYPGNRVARENPPDLLVIPTIGDVGELEKRLKGRTEKRDDAIFENLAFLAPLKPHYESEGLRRMFESLGTKVVYIDAGISVEETRRQAVEAVRPFFIQIP